MFGLILHMFVYLEENLWTTLLEKDQTSFQSKWIIKSHKYLVSDSLPTLCTEKRSALSFAFFPVN